MFTDLIDSAEIIALYSNPLDGKCYPNFTKMDLNPQDSTWPSWLSENSVFVILSVV